jgi:SAM-dependent methyltransferase
MSGYGSAGLADEYTAKAEPYARLWAPVLRAMAGPVLDALPLAGAARVLDLGPGTGDLLEPLRAHAPGARLVGVDRAEGMLRRIRADAGRVRAEATALPFGERAFDAALLAFMLFHLPDPVDALREVRRVLRTGGSVGVLTWGAHPDVPGGDLWTEALDAAGAPPDPRDASLMQQTRMDTPEKLAALLAEAGFTAARTGAAEFEHPWSVAQAVAIQVGVGMPGRRLAGLSEPARTACVDAVERRLRKRHGGTVVYRPQVVWAVAERAVSG